MLTAAVAESKHQSYGALIPMKERMSQVCKVITGDHTGTGFYAILQGVDCLVTNAHVINSSDHACNAICEFTIDGSNVSLSLLPQKLFWSSPRADLDCTIVALHKPETCILHQVTLAADLSSIAEEKDITILGHPDGEPLHMSSGRITQIVCEKKLAYSASTLPGSSGSPIYLNHTGEVIGIHHTGRAVEGNEGTIMSVIIQQFDVVDRLNHDFGNIGNIVSEYIKGDDIKQYMEDCEDANCSLTDELRCKLQTLNKAYVAEGGNVGTQYFSDTVISLGGDTFLYDVVHTMDIYAIQKLEEDVSTGDKINQALEEECKALKEKAAMEQEQLLQRIEQNSQALQTLKDNKIIAIQKMAGSMGSWLRADMIPLNIYSALAAMKDGCSPTSEEFVKVIDDINPGDLAYVGQCIIAREQYDSMLGKLRRLEALNTGLDLIDYHPDKADDFLKLREKVDGQRSMAITHALEVLQPSEGDAEYKEVVPTEVAMCVQMLAFKAEDAFKKVVADNLTVSLMCATVEELRDVKFSPSKVRNRLEEARAAARVTSANDVETETET